MNELKETKNKVTSAYVITVMAMTLIGIVLRCINLNFFYDDALGYYQSGTPLPVIMNLLFVAAVAAAFVFSVIINKKRLAPSAISRPVYLRISSAIGALFAVLSAADIFMYGAPIANGGLLFVGIAVAAISLLVLSFKSSDNVAATAAFLTVTFFVAAIIYTYFDSQTQMNSPHKILIELACIASMLFFIQEARGYTGTVRPRSYMFFLFCSLFLTGVSSVPSVIMYTANAFNYPYSKIDFALLGIFVYVAVRALSLIFFKEESITDTDSTPSEESCDAGSNEIPDRNGKEQE